MRLEPINKRVIGRIIITRVSSTIIASDPTKNVTKFVLVEAVSPEAEAAGYKPGDIILPRQVESIFLKGGLYHRATCSIDEIVCKVHDVPLNEFVDKDGKPVEEELSREVA